MQGHDEIWYATNMEICDYVNAMRGLVYSADGKRVFNPSIISVWMIDNKGEVIEVKPGDYVEL